MNKKLQTVFTTRQYMLSKDFEIYYYSDSHDENIRYRVRRHVHDYYEFYFFLEGEVSMEIDNVDYRLTPGDMILIPPHIKHHAVIHDTNRPYRRFVFWISESFCSMLLSESAAYVYLMQQAQLRERYIFHYDEIGFNALQSKAFQLIEELHSDRFGKEANVSLRVHDLILHLNRTVFESEHDTRVHSENDLYRSLIQYIETHLEEPLTLDDLAGRFYVSKYHISHLFKENMGISLHQFILKKRLAMCCDAILGSQEISEAYLLCGFRDYSSFYRAFKKEYGISPMEYKKRFEGLEEK